MSYSIVRSAKGGPDLLVEEPDPKLLTKEARADLVRRARQIREDILKRRNGEPIDVDAALEEMRAERGFR